MYRFAGGATATLETVWCMPDKTPYDIDERMNIVENQVLRSAGLAPAPTLTVR